MHWLGRVDFHETRSLISRARDRIALVHIERQARASRLPRKLAGVIEQGLAVAATAIGRVDSQKTDVEIVMFQLAARASWLA